MLPFGKLLILAVAGGGGVTAYYLTRPSGAENINYQGENKDFDCGKQPYQLSIGEIIYPVESIEKGEELKNFYAEQGQQGDVTRRPECPDPSVAKPQQPESTS